MTPKHHDVMARELLLAFRNRLIELYPDPDLIRDLGRLSIVERPYGYRLVAPKSSEHGHADRGMALAIALAVGLATLREYASQGSEDVIYESIYTQ